ncbi:MAG: hypothetical protein HRU80_03055 [Ignavibacteriales bacterium]|nr:MAG: hypothetical protein HRU80_03055 [Ignavibacteriales bacterium]
MKHLYNKIQPFVHVIIILSAMFYHGCAMYYSRIMTRDEVYANPVEVGWVKLMDSSEVLFNGGVTINNLSAGVTGVTADGAETYIPGEKIKELQTALPDAVLFDKEKVGDLKEIHLKNNISVRPDDSGFAYDAHTGRLSCRTEDGKPFSSQAESVAKYFTELPDTVSIERFFADTTISVKSVLMKPVNLVLTFNEPGAGRLPAGDMAMGYTTAGDLVTIPMDQIAFFIKMEGSAAGVAGNVGIVLGVLVVIAIIDLMTNMDADIKLDLQLK